MSKLGQMVGTQSCFPNFHPISSSSLTLPQPSLPPLLSSVPWGSGNQISLTDQTEDTVMSRRTWRGWPWPSLVTPTFPSRHMWWDNGGQIVALGKHNCL